MPKFRNQVLLFRALTVKVFNLINLVLISQNYVTKYFASIRNVSGKGSTTDELLNI